MTRIIDARAALFEHKRMQIGSRPRDLTALSRESLERIATLSSEGILLADAHDSEMTVVFANGAYEALTGFSAAELTGRPWPLAARADGGDPELGDLKCALGRAEACELTVPELRKDGSPWHCRLRLEPLYDARGRLKYFLCLQHPAAPIAAERAPEPMPRDLGRGRPRITHPDRVDPITGLLRFEHFKELLARDLALVRTEQRTVTLLAFETVELDVYRQTFGAKAADSCQRMIAAQVTRTLRRSSDLCARADDAVIVASVVDQHPVEVEPLAGRVAEHVRRLRLHNPRAKTERYVVVRTAVTSCVGIVDPEEALARAVAALRDAASADVAEPASSTVP